jgi:hypothetical protein
MDEQRHDGDAGDANLNSGVAGDATTSAFGDAGVAKDPMASPTAIVGDADVSAAISNKITYSVTIEDAQERFANAHRKVPSIRSLQRYCQEGLIKGLRTAVTYDNGSHGEPWFINDASLDAYIRKQPMVVLGDASDANQQVATPKREVGDANTGNPPNLATPATPRASEVNREASPPSLPNDEPPSIPLSDVLLENARLQERIEGKTEVIRLMEATHQQQRQDWTSERDFLRTDVTETRAMAREVRASLDRTLDTFKQIGTKQAEPADKVEPNSILYKPVSQNGQQAGESRPQH